MSTSFSAALSRAHGVISRAIGDEFVVIAPKTQTAHALEGAAARVWRSLKDGTTTAAPAEDVDAALAELIELGLVEQPATSFSRRSVLKKSGLVVAGAGIVTIALPPSIAAASPAFDFAAGKTTAGPILVQVPANPGGARTLKVTLTGASGGAGATLGGNGAGGATFTFNITQTGPAFTLLGYVGGGGKSGANPSAGGGSAGGASAAQIPGTFSASGGTGGGFGSTGNRFGGGGGAATYLTDSAGTLVAVVGGGGGGGGGAGVPPANTQAGGVGGVGANGASGASNVSGVVDTGATGTDGVDNNVAAGNWFGSAGAGGKTTPPNTKAGGAGGATGNIGTNGTPGAAGTATLLSGAGGAGGTYALRYSGNGGGGGGGFAGGGGAGSGTIVSPTDGSNYGSGGGGGGGSNYIGSGSFTGFSIATGITVNPGTTNPATGDGTDGSMAITT
jgi:hypothetical protein